MKKYLSFAKGAILETFAYRFSIIMWISGDFFLMFITSCLWIAIFNESGEPLYNGFTLGGLLTYTIVARVTSQLIYTSDTFWQLSSDIVEGQIANQLILPISYRKRLLSTTIGSFISQFFIIVIPILIVGYVILCWGFGVAIPGILNIIFFIISAFLGCILIDSFYFIFGQTAFFTGALFGLGEIKDVIIGFLAGAYLPIAFFPVWAKNILQFLPFGSMISTPVSILIGTFNIKEVLIMLGIQIFWTVVLSIIGKLLYMRSVKHVVSYGG